MKQYSIQEKCENIIKKLNLRYNIKLVLDNKRTETFFIYQIYLNNKKKYPHYIYVWDKLYKKNDIFNIKYFIGRKIYYDSDKLSYESFDKLYKTIETNICAENMDLL